MIDIQPEVQTDTSSKREAVRTHDGLKSDHAAGPAGPCLGVPTRIFLQAMSKRWATHRNTETAALRDTWSQICETFNRKLQEIGRPTARDWHVLSPATGTGKTESTIAYAALLPQFADQHAMLIVTRRIVAADELVKEINAEAGRSVAIAHHSEARVSPEDMRRAPVLVITHAAFERAVERIDGGRVWDALVAYGGHGRRDLVVIDEAVDLLELTKLTEDDLAHLVGAIPGEARRRWPAQTKYLEDLLTQLRVWVEATRGDTDSQRVMRGVDRARFDELFGELPDFGPLRQFMKAHRHVGSAKKGTKAEANADLAHYFNSTLTQVESLVRSFVLFAQQGKRTSFNSARTILPDDAQGCVILDATASVNRFYDVASREDGTFKIHRHKPPRGARSYANVALKVARVTTTGKGGLTKATEDNSTVGAKEAQRTLSWLQTHAASNRQVFIACHKDNAVHFVGEKGLPFELKVGTYGAIDGSNAFRECSTAVIFGLPWRDRVDATLTFFATQGVQPDHWLKQEAARAFRGYSDIRQELYLGWTAADLVQAINRTAMRRVVDAEGNCPKCDLYVMLPHGPNGDRILHALKEQLPGIQAVEAWEYKQAPRRITAQSEYSEKLKAYAKDMEPRAHIPVKLVRQAIGCGQRQWERLAAHMKDSTSDLSLSLRSIGVHYSVERLGSARRACLVRD